MKPTPEERAKNIICRFSNDPDAYLKLTDDIAAQIREACADTIKMTYKGGLIWKDYFGHFEEESIAEGYRLGFLACRDKAAEICTNETEKRACKDNAHDDRWCSACESMWDEANFLAEQILLLQPTGKKG